MGQELGKAEESVGSVLRQSRKENYVTQVHSKMFSFLAEVVQNGVRVKVACLVPKYLGYPYKTNLDILKHNND